MITGRRPLSGRVRAAGAKNAALPILASTLLGGGDCHITNLPQVRDVATMNTLLSLLGASVKQDGNQVVIDGLPAITDDDGLFNIKVPIGEHFVSISKQGHVFSVGRFPEVNKYNFQDDIAGMAFIDSTLIKVVGRVVGGLREANKKKRKNTFDAF